VILRFVIGDSNHESPNQQSQSTEAVTPKLHSSVGGRPFLCRAVARTPSGLDVTFRRRSHKNRRWRSRPRRQPGGDCGGNGITNGATGKRRRTGLSTSRRRRLCTSAWPARKPLHESPAVCVRAMRTCRWLRVAEPGRQLLSSPKLNDLVRSLSVRPRSPVSPFVIPLPPCPLVGRLPRNQAVL